MKREKSYTLDEIDDMQRRDQQQRQKEEDDVQPIPEPEKNAPSAARKN